ncbi:ROK family protein [Thalassotalea euphylliae]|uniref:N-acetylglucosamine kinase n=1 Tax=Thalassotalea euphylliae TaxID=1655234 RepID=A0A3E0TN77_9GAMM|nr:ROK family protein [Thalassotalea euphylliae]REL25572.1 ROK family protein [Thalassotalea euphylliae]
MTQAATAAHPANPYLYGMDIGGTKIEIAIYTRTLEFVTSKRVATPTDDYAQLLAVIAALIEQADLDYVHAGDALPPIGIGIPGINTPQGDVICANIPCLTARNFAIDIQQYLKRSVAVAVAKDSHLFALSEANSAVNTKANTSQTNARVFGAIIGTGAAGGLCQHGQLPKSRQSLMGEFGHSPIPASLIATYQLPLYRCGCGLTGCYETYIAGAGLGRLYQFFGAKSADTKAFAMALATNDSVAVKTFNCYIDILGAAIANIIVQHDPDTIVLGGGLSNIEAIIDKLPTASAKYLFAGIEMPTITKAKHGDSSGVRGAAILALQHERQYHAEYDKQYNMHHNTQHLAKANGEPSHD